jgi:hypothetical protein
MWLTIIIAVVLGYYIYQQLDKRLRAIEETRGPEYSHRFSVIALDAVLKHKKFGEISGIKSASEGKDYKDWSKEDKSKWEKDKKLRETLWNRINVNLTYLVSENAYFVSTYKNNPTIVHRDSNTNLLYSAIVVGDEDGLKDHIEFLIYERLIKYDQGKYGWVLTPCLQYRDDHIFDVNKNHSFTSLCDFPLFRTDLKDEEIKKLGFEIERNGGDDIYEDSFGEKHSIPTEIKYKKNGVEIRYVY